MTIPQNISLNQQITEAEIRWILRGCKKSCSFREFIDDSDTYKVMFTDSQIASKVTFSKTKAMYVTKYGIAEFVCKHQNSVMEKGLYISVSCDGTFVPQSRWTLLSGTSTLTLQELKIIISLLSSSDIRQPRIS